MATAAGGTAIPVASLNQWTIDLNEKEIDVTAFGDTTHTYVTELPDARGTLNGFWDDSDTTLYTAKTSGSGVPGYLYMSTNAVSRYAYGDMIPNGFNLSTDVAQAVTVKGTWVGSSSWTLKLS
jgi:hypothetical protein